MDDEWFEDAGAPDQWGMIPAVLRTERLQAVLAAPLPDLGDVEAATTLARAVYAELMECGTRGAMRTDDKGIALAQRALKAVLARLDITFDLPWRDFETFRTYWNANGCYGSWQRRRELVEKHFGPLFKDLDTLETAMATATVLEPVTPHSKTGWVLVDEEVSELRRRFRSASTPQDYRDVGNRCVATLEALSRTVYDPEVHLRPGEEVPSVDKTKQRIGRYIEDSLAGKDNAEVRGVATKVVALAHNVKHSPSPTRRDAGIAADAVLMLVNVVRRVNQPD